MPTDEQDERPVAPTPPEEGAPLKFEEVKGGFGEFVVGVGSELEDLGGSGGGLGCVLELFDDGDVVGKKTEESAPGDFASELFEGEFDGFFVGFCFDPSGDLHKLLGGEDGEGGFGVRRKGFLISDF